MLDAKEWLDVFPALDNTTRFNIMIYLSNEGPKSFMEVRTAFELQASSTQHHLDKLMDARLIVNSYRTPTGPTGPYSYYNLTERGKTILQILLTGNKP